jgi:hypothetical protein
MSELASQAVLGARNGLAEYEEELDLETAVPWAAALLRSLSESATKLHLTEGLLKVSSSFPNDASWRTWIKQVASNKLGREYIATRVCDGLLDRADPAVDRLVQIIELLPAATPPSRSLRFLEASADAYILGLDAGAIALARGAVEVMVEEVAPVNRGETLGATIAPLKKSRLISPQQAKDMFFVNDQAKEVLHDEPASHPVNAQECLRRVAMLLAELHPAGQPTLRSG